MYILLFVDDMLIYGRRAEVDRVKRSILARWKGKDLEVVETFVGFQIERDREARTLRIHQSIYTTKLLKRFRMDRSNPRQLLLLIGTVLAENTPLLEGDQLKLY